MKVKWVMIFLAVFLIWGAAGAESLRAEDDLGLLLKNGIYGGLIGALVGGAVLLLIDDSEDHLEILGYSTGSGILLGTFYGVTQLPRRSMVEWEGEGFSWNFPDLRVTREDSIRPPIDPGEMRFLAGKRVEFGIVEIPF